MPPTPAQPKSPTFAAHPTVGRAYAPDARATRIPDVRPTPPVGRAYAPDARATKIADDCRAFAGAKSRRGRSPDLRPSRSEEHTSELQSLMRIAYAVFCLKKKTTDT